MKLVINTEQDMKLFVTLLRNNILTFRYVKLDGSPRNARGSLHPRTINSIVPGTNGKNNAKYNQITYWDIFSNGWRSPRLLGQTIIVDSIEPVVEKEVPVRTSDISLSNKIKELQMNNRLHQIYKERETIKRQLKDYVKIVSLKGLSKQEKEKYNKKIDEIVKIRQELRAEVKEINSKF
jgi:hypothetical protein